MQLDELKDRLSDHLKNDSGKVYELERFLLALRAPSSFDEIEQYLPPKARYLGPGPWIDAIKNSFDKNSSEKK